jgi:hypothetical protein
MKLLNKRLIATCVCLAVALSSSLVNAQSKTTAPAITFDSFTGIYHLNRDSKGVSLLTTEETIVADFSGSGLYGIKRAIPEKYQNSSVNVKILNVSDAAGNPVPYKTANDNGNLVVTTGNPDISLYGSQTIKIKYQTSDVVNLAQKSDQFLLDVNGRGWDSSFNTVNATLYIPASFRAKLINNPICYLALNTSVSNNCQIQTQKSSQTSVISSKAKFLDAHQTLVLKADFQPSTFTSEQGITIKNLLIGAGILLALGLICWNLFYKRHREPKKT